MSYVVVFLLSMSSEIIVRFVGIGGIDGHHCLNFLYNTVITIHQYNFILIKMKISNKCARRVADITFIRYAQNRNIGKPNLFKVFGSNKSKYPKQDRENRLWLFLPEGGHCIFKLLVSINLTC